ncbi:MAG: transposase family protein, partial [Gammaproteobacteria bacterium]|nr:transposase family protein [Gammaproteobacteria bacterium]
RSGLATVQVDYMPMGRDELGWKGEVGAYIFSDRTSKVVKAYPVTGTSTEAAILALEHYLIYVADTLTHKIECIQTDAVSQFVADEWSNACQERGIKSRTCPVDHQAMNGQVERVQGTLCNLMRAMMKTTQVPREYWPLALENAAYLFNRTPHTSLEYKTPLEVGTKETPDTSNVRVFGCKAYVQVPKSQRQGKLNDTAWVGIMVGFSTNSPEWLILDPRTLNVRKAYSVTFRENTSGFDDFHQETNSDTETTTPAHSGEYSADTYTPMPAAPSESDRRNCNEREGHEEKEAMTTMTQTENLYQETHHPRNHPARQNYHTAPLRNQNGKDLKMTTQR